MSASLQFNYTGGSDNAEPNQSLGGAHSDTQLSSTALNNLFDDVSPDEAANGATNYRAVDVTNVGDEASASTGFYLKQALLANDGDPYTENTLEFGAASEAGTTDSIADESAAPSGITFGSYPDSDDMLSMPDVPAGSYVRVWVRRTVSAGAPNDRNVHGTIAVQYA